MTESLESRRLLLPPLAPTLIVVALLVLLLTSWWLVVTPRATPAVADAPPARLAALEQRLEAMAVALERAQRAEARLSPALDRALQAETRLSTRDAQGPLAEQAAGLAALARLEAEHYQEMNGHFATLQAGLASHLRGLMAEIQPRLEALEAAQQQLVAMEGRMARLASLDALRAALAAGHPLGEALTRLPNPDPALWRFAKQAPLTESALRQRFEEAARAARAAAVPLPMAGEGRPGLLDGALQRLGGLVTVRRGDQVVLGDAVEVALEQARRALEAGELDAALAQLDRLPPGPRAAMAAWAEEARALLAARAALRGMAAG